MKRKNASAIIYIIFFISVILLFCSFAVDTALVMNIRNRLQSASETAALLGAAALGEDTPNVIAAQEAAQEVLSLLKADFKEKLLGTEIKINPEQRQIYIEANASAPTFFLAFAGVANVKLVAKSAAQNDGFKVEAKSNNILWADSSTTYKATVLDNLSKLQTLDKAFPLLNPDYSKMSNENSPLSLGPAGYITVKLPAPMIDKPGVDVKIKEVGLMKDGYKVYAGIDKNPDVPYTKGGQASWADITCSGTPAEFYQNGFFYGSGSFKFETPCTGEKGITIAKYIRIVDDNQERAYHAVNGNYYWILGDSMTSTAGADIGGVEVMNYTRLIAPKDFVQ